MDNEKRFVQVMREGLGFGSGIKVLVDRVTRVQYLIYYDNPISGMTVLIGADGQPLLYEGDL